MAPMEDAASKKAALEALIFLSGDPVSASELKNVIDMPETDINDLLEELMAEYAQRGGGLLISRIAGGYQLHTNPEFNEYARKLKGTVKSQKLSMPALETLAIVAYRQPITKVEVEELRGVNSDGVIKSLLDKRLIKIMGKKEAPGRPIMYGTTREFLQYFGLSDLAGLPTLKDLDREGAA